jgi:cellulose synthase/poly-beta-1,6-N-acetylglucosamine synthase-like glycosyltransferase
MNALLQSLWLAVHGLLAVPVVWVWLQSLLARNTKRQHLTGQAPTAAEPTSGPATIARGSIAVLIPAHNESSGLLPTLASLRPQLTDADRIVVVADNCNDDTAAVARAAGAEVIERFNTTQRGKGYALDFGMKHLAAKPPGLVLMCDADCLMHDGSVAQLASTVTQHQQPAQALYLMTAPAGAGMQQRFAEFAWRMKNQTRPLGALAMGAPCQLMGTGMMFPWHAISAVPLASGHIVEDMQMGVDLALNGHVPRFEPNALVTSRFPDSTDGAKSQRARWEHGHMATLLHAGPQLLRAGLMRGRVSLLAMGLDLMVPPLALLLMLVMGLLVLDVALWLLLGWQAPLIVGAVLLGLFAGAVLLAWARFGAGTITGRELLTAPIYALRKIPLYLAFFIKRQTEWVRAKRDGE